MNRTEREQAQALLNELAQWRAMYILHKRDIPTRITLRPTQVKLLRKYLDMPSGTLVIHDVEVMEMSK